MFSSKKVYFISKNEVLWTTSKQIINIFKYFVGNVLSTIPSPRKSAKTSFLSKKYTKPKQFGHFYFRYFLFWTVSPLLRMFVNVLLPAGPEFFRKIHRPKYLVLIITSCWSNFFVFIKSLYEACRKGLKTVLKALLFLVNI